MYCLPFSSKILPQIVKISLFFVISKQYTQSVLIHIEAKVLFDFVGNSRIEQYENIKETQNT